MASDAPEPETGRRPVRRPTLVYDGTCGFCWRSALRLQGWTGDAVAITPYQAFDFGAAPAGMTRDACAESVHLVEADGTVRRGADACVAAFAHAPGRGFAAPLFRAIPGLPKLAEVGYRLVAGNRVRISKSVKVLAGPDPTPPGWLLGRRAFVVLLALAHLCAAWAMAGEAEALFGPNGLTPMAGFFPAEGADVPVTLGSGFETPSLFWFGTGTAALWAVLGLWFVGALVLLAGFAPRLGLLLAAASCLSFSATALPPTGVPSSGNPFVGYQWDGLLIEASFLALFVVPGGLRPGARWRARPPWSGRLLLRLLLARALFLEAVVRTLSVSWQQEGAFDRHLWTQRLPTSWALDLQGGFGAGLLGWLWPIVGFAAPFLLFAPRRLRLFGVVLVLTQEWTRFLTGLTGTYPLVLAACALLAVDDLTFKRLLPRGVGCRWARPEFVATTRGFAVAGRWLAALLLAALALHVSWRFVGEDPEPSAVQDLVRRFQICNGYAPFPDVAADRPVLLLEVQDTPESAWRQLEPRQATGAALALPPWPSPVLRRFDWELGGVARAASELRQSAWFGRMQANILVGNPEVLGLFAPGSFPDGAPARIRVRLFRYRPAGPGERATGQGWDREPMGLEGVPLELRDGQVVPVGR